MNKQHSYMKQSFLTKLAALLLVFASTASADTPAYEYNSAWIAGGDNITVMQRTADWYKSVFGMLEVDRYFGGVDRGFGIALNFGASTAEAKAAIAPALGIGKSFPGVPGAPGQDNFARASFNVTQLELILQRVVDNGGKVESKPTKQGNATFAVVRDPIGNLIELTAASNADTAASRPKVSWRSIRLPALNAEKTAKFYSATLGMQEIARAGTQEVTLNFGAATVPLKIVTVSVMPRPSASVSASQLAVTFKDTEAMNGALRRSFTAGGRYLTEPHYNSETKKTYLRMIDPNGNFLELSGVCKASEVGSTAATFICGS